MSIAQHVVRLSEIAMAHTARVAIELIKRGHSHETIDADDDDDGDDDTREILIDLQDRMERLGTQLLHVTSELRQRAQIPRLIGNVLLLWQSEEGPRCVSHTVRFAPSQLGDSDTTNRKPFGSDPTGSRTIEPRLLWAVPPGAWVVAINCAIESVHVSAEIVDLGPAPRGAVAVLSNGVPLGALFQLVVKPER